MKAVFTHVCNVSNLTDQCFEPNAKGLYAHKLFPMASNSFAFKWCDICHVNVQEKIGRHLFYEYVVEFNEQNELRLVFSSWNVFELDVSFI